MPHFVVPAAEKEIADTKRISKKACEQCGAPGSVGTTDRNCKPTTDPNVVLNSGVVAKIAKWLGVAFFSREMGHESEVSAASVADLINPTTSHETQSVAPVGVSLKGVLAISAAECSGQGPLWFCLPLTVLPDHPAVSNLNAEVEAETLTVESERLRKSSLAPPLSPPKIV